MFHIDEGPTIKVRANRLVDQVFAAQLEVLQSILPLGGWLLGHQDNGHFSTVASTGMLVNPPRAVLASLTDGPWAQQTDANTLCHRKVDSKDFYGLDPAVGSLTLASSSVSSAAVHLIRIALNNTDGTSQAYLFGLSDSCPCGHLKSVEDQVFQCRDAMGLIMALCTELTALSQRATEIQRDAFIDPLTQVMNRAGWNHYLQQLEVQVAQEAATATEVAIIMLDLDLLKEVNDSRGHSAGDDLLCLTAHTITSVLRSGDMVARLGGDEFGIIVKNALPDSAVLLMQRLKEAFDKVRVGISMGAAMQSEVGDSLQDTVQMADQRMYADKRTKPAMGKHYLDWMLGHSSDAASA